MFAKEMRTERPREEAEFGVIIALLQFVLEHAEEIGKNLNQLSERPVR